MAAGPLATVRYLTLLIRSLTDIEQRGAVRLPGKIDTTKTGQLRVQVFPTRGLFDSVLFAGFRADVWMQPGVTRENLSKHTACYVRPESAAVRHCPGAGGRQRQQHRADRRFQQAVPRGQSRPLEDESGQRISGRDFAQAFAPLIEAGFLRIIYGGAEVGTYAVEHESVDEVHITGSIFSHETIVWGPPGADRERRKAEGAATAKADHERTRQRHALDRHPWPLHRSRADVSGRERGGDDHEQRVVQLHCDENDRYQPRMAAAAAIPRQDRSGAQPDSTSPRLLPGRRRAVHAVHWTPAGSRGAPGTLPWTLVAMRSLIGTRSSSRRSRSCAYARKRRST